MIEAAIEAGLEGLAFCDHNRLVPPAHLAELNARYAPFRIFAGIELDVESEHILVFGMQDSRLEHERWDWPRLHAFVRENGGALVLAHPYRFHDGLRVDIERFRPDAVEINSSNMVVLDRSEAEALVARLQFRTVTNSDAHHTTSVGRFWNRLERPVLSDAELVRVLREGAFSPGTPMPPPQAARIG
jgi:predicted metal-dependent phosphoesterase TrpH